VFKLPPFKIFLSLVFKSTAPQKNPAVITVFAASYELHEANRRIVFEKFIVA
jgi:hypothetical protein